MAKNKHKVARNYLKKWQGIYKKSAKIVKNQIKLCNWQKSVKNIVKTLENKAKNWQKNKKLVMLFFAIVFQFTIFHLFFCQISHNFCLLFFKFSANLRNFSII